MPLQLLLKKPEHLQILQKLDLLHLINLRDQFLKKYGWHRFTSMVEVNSPSFLQKQWVPQAEQIISTLKETHSRLQELFGDIPQFRTAVQLMDEDTFFSLPARRAGRTRCTTKIRSLFQCHQLKILILKNSIQRSIRHEYTHAVTHALSNQTVQDGLTKV